jgi:hypothetical protein
VKLAVAFKVSSGPFANEPDCHIRTVTTIRIVASMRIFLNLLILFITFTFTPGP